MYDREYAARYRQTQAYRDAIARYQSTERWQEVKERYRTSPTGRAKMRGYAKAARVNSPDRARARDAVNNALRRGRLTRPDRCSTCGTTEYKRLEAHHTDGYTMEHRLTVTWLCVTCHKAIHRN